MYGKKEGRESACVGRRKGERVCVKKEGRERLCMGRRKVESCLLYTSDAADE